MIRADNPVPFGASLLDKSTAKPGSIDMDIFAPKRATAREGSTSSDYLRKTREENSEPETTAESADSVQLSGCKIDTPPEELATDQPFEMSVEVKSQSGEASGTVTFQLLCALPKPDGSEEVQDQSSPTQASISKGSAKARGTLVSPKTPVASGTRLKYHVVAEHPAASEKSESPKIEVEAGKPPKPLAIWTLEAVHFGFDSSFILPGAAGEIASLGSLLEQHPGAAAAVFGHADPVGKDDFNKTLSGRRAYATYCLLTKDSEGWLELAKGGEGDKWDLRTTQTMLAHLDDSESKPYYGGKIDGIAGSKTDAAIKNFQKAQGLKPDGNAGPKTDAELFPAYMASLGKSSLEAADFLGDPQDKKRQWACAGCGEFNPVLVFSKGDQDKFEKSGDAAARNARNAPNRRATVLLFPASAKGPGKVDFPCPAWNEGADKCRKQFFQDADARRNPSDRERTWEKDKDTFACRFLAGIADEKTGPGGVTPRPDGAWDLGLATFATSSAVPAPKDSRRIVHLLSLALRAGDGAELVVTGHCDPPGGEASNQALSEARAQALLSIAIGDRAMWWNAIGARHTDADATGWLGHLRDAYGWDCDPDGSDAGVPGFQAEFNLRYDGDLVVDGIMGEQSWKALHTALHSFVAFGSSGDRGGFQKPALGLGGKGWIGFGEEFHPERMACVVVVPAGADETLVRCAIESGPEGDPDAFADDVFSIDTVLMTNSGTNLVANHEFLLNDAENASLVVVSDGEGRLRIPDLPSGEYPFRSRSIDYQATIGSTASETTCFRLDGFLLPPSDDDPSDDDARSVDGVESPSGDEDEA